LLYDVFSAKLAMHIVVYTNKYEDENTKCHTIGTVPKYNRRIVEDTKVVITQWKSKDRKYNGQI
jgi:hypothetical protein